MAVSSFFQYHIEFLLLCLLLCTTIFNYSLVMCNNSKTVLCDENEKNTLLKFKYGIIDPSGVLSSWSIKKRDCCEWWGVHCDNITNKVIELSLPCPTIYPVYGDYLDKSHCLTGELDMSFLFDLKFLSYLDLRNNDFNTIQYHGLHENSPSNLHHLDLSNNDNLKASNIFHWISNISSLQYLDLTGINLQKETNWLQSVTVLPSLSKLFLESCGLQNIYPTLQYVNFTALKVLDLFDNEFVCELPSWVFNLSSDISMIDFSLNFMYGQLPETLPHFQNLEYLALHDNDLNGPIPNWVSQLQKLQKLNLASNSFSGPVPTTLGNLSSLTFLFLFSNNLTGMISQRNFHSLSKLKSLGLGSESLIFDFDPQWIPPFQLQFLILTFMSPKLPSWIYTQNSLTLLNIVNSRITLEPLDKFWKFAANQVEYLDLQNNSISDDMSNVMLNSKIVSLGYNNLRGSVPRVSPNVTLLDLSHNSLSGSISPFLCPKTKEKNTLKYVDISHNLLSKEIPNCWMYWKSLLYINLGDNNLIGQIPHSIGSLSNLISLSLYNNMLSGEVPLSLKNCQKLRLLNLGENEFSGVISSWIGQSVIGLQLRSNQFSGNISTEICQFHSLKILDLSNNRLSGSIPNCCRNMTGMISKNESFDSFHVTIPMTNVTFEFNVNFMLLIKGIKLNYTHSMRVVDISSNNLFGLVPSELFMLIGLQSLNLSHNQLMGKIPQNIGNLTLLESLDLSSNVFSGQIPESMSALSFLEVLNLSCNNFEGKIPSGTQLQSFTNLSYVENPKLCGPPLTKICPQDEKLPNAKQMREDDDDNDNSQVYSWFYMGLGIGFATSFWAVLIAVFFNRRFRHFYFKCLDRVYDMVI
ncbi:receptor-like protein EIX1 [Arachis stenosperma]|uniref:receptor-like protein EIX1 n=1 Tax=Arachis stenosperma TaxID=217475 RepID=UPI0025AB6FFC|nr:receptor-like protein EIX1 [Arachis stenosperma]